MIKNLPELLIFDDIERCEMSSGELLGLINKFVEHQTKNVVLCAFIEREDKTDKENKRDDFLSRKEKVVGRTVRIVADAQNALSEFISAMPEGHGKQWYQSNVGLVLKVFTEATHSNLRILRQCLHDCGRVIDVLDEDLRISTDAMTRFVRTYLALAMAIATGKTKPQELRDRSDYKCLTKSDDGGEPHSLYKCVGDHPHAEIYTGSDSSIIPLELGFSLIGIGFEASDMINRTLRATGQFSGTQAVPLWRRFVEWRVMSKADLESTYKEALAYIYEDEVIEPGPYLQIADTLIIIAQDGCRKGDETTKKIKNRIVDLAKMEKIPPATYGESYGWSIEIGKFAFGGVMFSLNDRNRLLIEAMKNAQFLAFGNSQPAEAKRLLDLLRKDIEAFGLELSWGNDTAGYHTTSILHEIDAIQFANAIFEYIILGHLEAIKIQVIALSERHRSGNVQEELFWAFEVQTALSNLAEKAGPLEKARMAWFLEVMWSLPV